MTKLIHKEFGLVGFRKMDMTALSSSMLAAKRRATHYAMHPNTAAAKEWAGEWRSIMGNEAFDGMVRDLKNNTTSDAVKWYAYMRASEARPIDKLDMPETYNEHPTLRILYQLKTFGMLQLNLIRKQGLNDLARGLKTQDFKLARRGTRRLVRAIVMLTAANASVDWVRDWILGRHTNLEDNVINGLLSLGMGSTYLVHHASQDGPGSAMLDFLAPPAISMIDTAFHDIVNGTYHSLKYMPFGKLVYSHTSEGKAQSNKYHRLAVKSAAVSALADGDRAAAVTYVRAYNNAIRSTPGKHKLMSFSEIRREVRRKEKKER